MLGTEMDWELPSPLYLPLDHPVHKFAEQYRLLALWNVIWYGLFWLLLVALATAFLWLPSVVGSIYMVIGNAILRVHDPVNYLDDWTSATIGIAGGTFVGLPSLVCFVGCTAVFQIRWLSIPGWVVFVTSICYGTLVGIVGSWSIKFYNETRQVTDVLHATGAGVLGGIIVGTLFLLPMLIDVLRIVCQYFRLNKSSGLDIAGEDYMLIPLFDMDLETDSGSQNGLDKSDQ